MLELWKRLHECKQQIVMKEEGTQIVSCYRKETKFSKYAQIDISASIENKLGDIQ